MKTFLIKSMDTIVTVLIGLNLFVGLILAIWLGGASSSFGVFLLVVVATVIFTAITTGPLLIMLQNNTLLKEIRDNTKNG
tara:strand:- start:395 stop:634 length:240 start_codon:yes stop_codon:yes gene_type:complete